MSKRNQRATVNSKTVSSSHGRPVGKAKELKPEKAVKVPTGGEIRTAPNGKKYIYLPPVEHGEPVRRF